MKQPPPPPPKELVQAWYEYWTEPDVPVRVIAQRNHINPTSIHSMWNRYGWTQRRKRKVRKILNSTPARTCPGYDSFCAHCPAALPKCEFWHCHSCDYRMMCPCINASLRPKGWAEAFGIWQRKQDRKERALQLYRYAWLGEELAAAEYLDVK